MMGKERPARDVEGVERGRKRGRERGKERGEVAMVLIPCDKWIDSYRRSYRSNL